MWGREFKYLTGTEFLLGIDNDKVLEMGSVDTPSEYLVSLSWTSASQLSVYFTAIKMVTMRLLRSVYFISKKKVLKEKDIVYT